MHSPSIAEPQIIGSVKLGKKEGSINNPQWCVLIGSTVDTNSDYSENMGRGKNSNAKNKNTRKDIRERVTLMLSPDG